MQRAADPYGGLTRSGATYVPSTEGRGFGPPTARDAMLDLLFLAIAAGFFALAWAYVRACDRL